MRGNLFGPWLQSQLRRREMNQSELARKLETSSSAVSGWVRQGRVPTPESCDKIADALGIPVDEVLMAAGHRPRGLDEWDEDVREVASLMQRLPDNERDAVRDFARWRYERGEKDA